MNIRMVTQVEVTREEPSTLVKRVWSFHFIDSYSFLVLQEYAVWERETKRHKYRMTKNFTRYNNRQCVLRAEDVEMPDDVRKEAFSTFMEKLSNTIICGTDAEMQARGHK